MLSQARQKNIKLLLKKLKAENADLNLTDEALTHPSFNFEKGIENGVDYERLEFLGDSVLRLVISELLFDKFSSYDEGKLTKIRSFLVSDDMLYKIAQGFELNKHLNIGEHEEKDGGRNKPSILACAMEAVFGAIYKSLGYEEAKNCINNIYNKIDFNISEILYLYNSKEILQQYTQSKNKDLPQYKIINETGAAHNKTYEVTVEYEGQNLGIGMGRTKKEAEKKAALNALKYLKLLEAGQNE